MFSEHDFKYIPLVLALLAYLGAVRIAIRQRLGAILVEMHKEHSEHDQNSKNRRPQWFALHKHARRGSRALMLLIPADLMIVGVAAGLLYNLLFGQFYGSLTNLIDYGIMLGAAYLLALHVREWIRGHRPATKPYPAPGTPKQDDVPTDFPLNGSFNTGWQYRCVWLIPLLALVGLVAWQFCHKEPPKDAEAHYQLGRALYDQGRFEAAIARQRRAVRLDEENARYHYALAKAMARKNAEYWSLGALLRAIEIDERFRYKARNEPAFDFIRDDPPFHELISEPPIDGSGSPAEGGGPTTQGSGPSAEGSGSPTESGGPPTDGGEPPTEGGGSSTDGSGSSTDGGKSSAGGG